MWLVLILLVVGSCYSSGEQFEVTVAELPVAPAAPAERPAGEGGTAAADARIIGGSPATIETYPYAVQVLRSSQLSCGGSLLTRRHVLSAAHCFADNRGVLIAASLFSIRAGSATLNSGGSTHGVSRIINHERYNIGAARDNDISILLLSSAVTLSARVALATIPAQGNRVPYNSGLVVVGWGTTNANVNQASTVLNHVGVYAIDTGVCATRYWALEQIKNEPFPVTDNMMCSGILDVGGRDACQGDSGGPVMYAGIVVGVTSWGEGCAHPTYPGVNARVSAYTNWINVTITQNSAAASLGHTSACILLLSFLVSMVFRNKL